MGWWHRAGIALSGLAGWIGVGKPVVGEEARSARVTELYQDYRSEYPDVPEVLASDLLADDRGWLVVDVRPAAERVVSTLPGAVSLEDLEREPGLLDGRTVVAYCTIGYRSGMWAAEQRAAGVDARNLVAGVLGWGEAGGTFVDADGPTRRVHVYGPTWDLLPEGYEAVW